MIFFKWVGPVQPPTRYLLIFITSCHTLLWKNLTWKSKLWICFGMCSVAVWVTFVLGWMLQEICRWQMAKWCCGSAQPVLLQANLHVKSIPLYCVFFHVGYPPLKLTASLALENQWLEDEILFGGPANDSNGKGPTVSFGESRFQPTNVSPPISNIWGKCAKGLALIGWESQGSHWHGGRFTKVFSPLGVGVFVGETISFEHIFSGKKNNV